MRTQRPTSDWRVTGAFADTNTKFKKNTINVIDEGRRVGQQSTKTLTTRSSTKTQNNKNTVSVVSGDKRSTDALPTRCRRVPRRKKWSAKTSYNQRVNRHVDCIAFVHTTGYGGLNVWLITNLNYLFQSWVTWASLSYMCANGRYEMWTSSLDIRIPH